MHKNYDQKVFIVLDLEFTSGHPLTISELIEIGALKIKGGKIIGKFHTFVNPKYGINYDVMRLTGIKNRMVKNSPNENAALRKLKQFTGDYPIVAHGNYDKFFLEHKFELYNLGTIHNIYIDTHQIIEQEYPELEKTNLQVVAENFKLVDFEKFDEHRAVDDAYITFKLFDYLIHLCSNKEEKGTALKVVDEYLANKKKISKGKKVSLAHYSRLQTGYISNEMIYEFADHFELDLIKSLDHQEAIKLKYKNRNKQVIIQELIRLGNKKYIIAHDIRINEIIVMNYKSLKLISK